MIHKILAAIGSKYAAKAREILKPIGNLDCQDLTQNELEKKISKYNILIVGLGLNINQKVITKGKNLKIIATATTGLDHIDVDFAKQRGIKVLSLLGENDFLNTITGTAELAFGLIIDLMRFTCFSFESVKNYEWNREKFRGHSLYGQTLGIAGLGRLGRWVARYGQAFNMRVIAYDPMKDDDYFTDLAVKKVDFIRLLEESDVISIHLHLDEKTKNMFNKECFSRMKDTSYLINTSRGKIVDEDDLLTALKNKEIAGYGTDVLADELNFSKSFSNHPLVEYAKKNNNLIIFPHIGGMTHESREATDIFIAKKIKKYLKI